jgi:hypothetical protein
MLPFRKLNSILYEQVERVALPTRGAVAAGHNGRVLSFLVYGALLNVIAYEKEGEKFIKTKPTKDLTDGLLSVEQC